MRLFFWRKREARTRTHGRRSTCRVLGFAEAQARAAAYREHRLVAGSSTRTRNQTRQALDASSQELKRLVDRMTCGHPQMELLKPARALTGELWKICFMCPTSEAFYYLDTINKRLVNLGALAG